MRPERAAGNVGDAQVSKVIEVEDMKDIEDLNAELQHGLLGDRRVFEERGATQQSFSFRSASLHPIVQTAQLHFSHSSA